MIIHDRQGFGALPPAQVTVLPGTSEAKQLSPGATYALLGGLGILVSAAIVLQFYKASKGIQDTYVVSGHDHHHGATLSFGGHHGHGLTFELNRRRRRRGRRMRRNAGTMPHPEPEGWHPGAIDFPRDETWVVDVMMSGAGRVKPAVYHRVKGSRLVARSQAQEIVRQLAWMGIEAYATAPRRA